MSFEKTFTWRGKLFTWNGRKHIYESPCGWWVSHTRYQHYRFLDERGEALKQGSSEEILQEARCSFMAHCGYAADGAVAGTRLEALEASLQMALRYHHQQIAQLRELCFTVDPTPP